jgi:TM2 domain-containing membrane protein YozV
VAVEELVHLQGMNDQQRLMFMAMYSPQKKSTSAGFWWAFLLGGLGAHRFYLNDNTGIIYLLLCWTFIPAFIAFFESFSMADRVRRYNAERAWEVAQAVRSQTTGVAGAAPGWYPDPYRQGVHRYWDGSAWGAQTS